MDPELLDHGIFHCETSSSDEGSDSERKRRDLGNSRKRRRQGASKIPTYRCGVCLHSPPLQLADIIAHIDSAEHQENFLQHAGAAQDDEGCDVLLNGIRMILDNHVIFPHTMFGPGAALFDETLKVLISTDACGGVRLRPRHSYTVIRLSIPMETSVFAHVAERKTRTPSSYFGIHRRFRECGDISGPSIIRRALKQSRERERQDPNSQ
jgi:hypothetical protein